MSRVIKKVNHTVILNVGSLGIDKLNSLCFGYSASQIRLTRVIDRINEFKQAKQHKILICKNNKYVYTLRASEFKKDRTTGWREYSNGFEGLSRRDEERAERVFKSMTPTEFSQFFTARSYVHNTTNFDNYDPIQGRWVNEFYQLWRDGFSEFLGLEGFLVKMLSQEKRHFDGLKEYSGHGTGFSRFYVTLKDTEGESLVMKLSDGR